MKTRARLAAGVAALATGLLLVPAHAAPTVRSQDRAADTYLTSGQGRSGCPTGRFCLYENDGYNAGGSAQILVTRSSVSSLGTYGFNDKASSYYDNTSQPVVLHENADYGGGQLSIRSQGSGNLAGSWNDKVSSLRFLS
ncbi:peptidase inhibitor family I36 protein [Kitasatospora sp. NPDC048298]|uniref:peptidase inhibitor family I36 protein n=1 Tax=Kitasatospora sp. NPDC048298 TaxID=3364049 RepID=UPI003714694A